MKRIENKETAAAAAQAKEWAKYIDELATDIALLEK
jgi:hypothetical protein